MKLFSTYLKMFFILFLMIAGFAFAQSAGSPAVVVRTSVESMETIWLGQRVSLFIDILGRDGWAQIKRAGDFKIPGALVLRVETQGTRIQETIDGQSYSGQRYELLVFPKRAGTIQVPVIPLEVEIKQWGSDAQTVIENLNTTALQIQVKMPPGVQDSTDLISSTGMRFGQQWQPGEEDLKVGDSLKRAITIEAPDIPGAAFPPLRFDPVKSTAVYPAEPLVEDRSNRGSLVGVRTETVTYVFQKAGRVQLPDMAVTWWDISNKKLNREILKGIGLKIKPNPALASSTVNSSVDSLRWLPFLFLALIAIVGWTFHRRLLSSWQSWQQEYRETEKAYYKRFVKAARSGKPADAYKALMRWLDRINSETVAACLDQFLETYSDPGIAAEAERLVQSIDTKSPWNGTKLARGIKVARKLWMARHGRPKAAKRLLPLLNP